MRKTLATLLVMLALLACAGLTNAGSLPLVVAHTLTGYHQEETATTLDFALHVENRGDKAVTELTLSLVPAPPLLGSRPTISIGYLGPREATDVTVQVETRLSLEEEKVAHVPLFWAGSFLNAEGKRVEFPVQSKAGGAK